MAILEVLAAVALGLATAALLHPQASVLARVRRGIRWLAAGWASLYGILFGAGTVGALGGGDMNTTLPTLALGLVAVALLLWRGPQRHHGILAHWLAALWLLYSAFASRHSVAVSHLFLSVAVPALWTAILESAGPRAQEERVGSR